jgi:hypothetical protein
VGRARGARAKNKCRSFDSLRPISTPQTKTFRRGPRFAQNDHIFNYHLAHLPVLMIGLVERYSLPPSRQENYKKQFLRLRCAPLRMTAKTGHGAVVSGPAWVHSSRNSPWRVMMLRQTTSVSLRWRWFSLGLEPGVYFYRSPGTTEVVPLRTSTFNRNVWD